MKDKESMMATKLMRIDRAEKYQNICIITRVVELGTTTKLC